MAGTYEFAGCGDHIVLLSTHASAVVDHEANRCRCVLWLENLDRLLAPVFKHPKIVRGETRDRLSIIEDSDVENDEVDINRYSELKSEEQGQNCFGKHPAFYLKR